MSYADPIGVWQLSQSTGQLTDLNGNVVAIGYAGHGAGVNNPAMENVPDTGPINQGTYTIGSQQNNVTGRGRVLPSSMRLITDAETNASILAGGRTGGYLIHSLMLMIIAIHLMVARYFPAIFVTKSEAAMTAR